MTFFDETFSLREMIDSDIRHYKAETGEGDISSLGASHLDSTTSHSHHLNSIIDSDLSDDGGTGWMDSSQIFNTSAEIDELSCVDPQTVLPVSIPVSIPLSSNDSSNMLTSNNTLTISTSGSIAVTLPIQVITSNSDMTDANLISSMPTPSPSPHNMTSQQLFSEHDTDTSQDSDSPKPKFKNKNVKSNQQHSVVENAYPKPAYSYSCLIAMALKNSKTGSLPVNEIYDFMTENFPYFKTAPNGWKNSVRHNLSLNKCFEKIEKPSGNSAQRKGYLWAMNPAKIEKMEEELQKWGSKDPAAIRKSMANPERLELIEKGELRNESDPEVEDMNISQVAEEEKYTHEEKENEMKVQNMGNEMLNNDFPALGESVNIDACIDLDLQKGIWEDLCEDRLQFLNDSPSSPLSPKNSETMEDELSLESTPSSQKPYLASYIYKRASGSNNRKFSPIKSGPGKSPA
ncbi:forkhead box protein N4 [Parasteatoda tepidariorum]|uniref:forkhead box protein N4 n=1 Tax=Parasteatoda tepidariorum TaxID=114398 RepID=UPI00077F8D51|nr:forkhead box protein N4 [Parasteatoda tepidariorum]XP_015917896.1 forkhead box protein N4 [Parasteatoda tepidariorum]